MLKRASSTVTCRQITTSDLPEVIDLLQAGFPHRPRSYWANGIGRLEALPVLDGFPRFGYVLEVGGTLVGVLLLISSHGAHQSGSPIRCNVSSWYVRPEYRAYASLLSRRATRHQPAIFLNISAAWGTMPILEAQGFIRFCHGLFIGIPALDLIPRRARMSWRPEEWRANPKISGDDLTLLLDHHAFGCTCLWYETDQFCTPLIFAPRRIWHDRLPCVQLIYSPPADRLQKIFGKVGRALALRGYPIVLIPSNGPIPGIFGKYYQDWSRMYFKGRETPSVEDLSYTEAAVFGL